MFPTTYTTINYKSIHEKNIAVIETLCLALRNYLCLNSDEFLSNYKEPEKLDFTQAIINLTETKDSLDSQIEDMQNGLNEEKNVSALMFLKITHSQLQEQVKVINQQISWYQSQMEANQ